MATTADVQPEIDPADQKIRTLLAEHRLWRARLRNAIEAAKQARAHAVTIRKHMNMVSTSRVDG